MWLHQQIKIANTVQIQHSEKLHNLNLLATQLVQIKTKKYERSLPSCVKHSTTAPAKIVNIRNITEEPTLVPEVSRKWLAQLQIRFRLTRWTFPEV